MKKITIIFICILSVLVSSCADYLDVSDELAGNITVEEVFDNVTYTKQWYGNCFNCISEYSSLFWNPSGFQNPWASLCGETTVCWGSVQYTMLNGFNAQNAGCHRYNQIYQYIRQCHLFLDNAKPVGNSTDQNVLTEADIQRMKSEVKFLIAYSYFSLFELYGPVPLIKEAISTDTKDLDFERASTDEVLDYVDGVLDEVLKEDKLPNSIRSVNPGSGQITYNLNEMVRPTKAVVLAIRAKMWVYAASTLFNGGYKESLELVNNDGKKLFSSYDPNKWQKAKEHLALFLDFAKKEGFELYQFKNMDGTTNPSKSVYQLFQEYNDEIIWATANCAFMSVVDNTMERRLIPRDLLDGWCGIGCSQQMVDAFFTQNGLTISDPGSGYDEKGFSDVMNPCAYPTPRLDKQVFNMYANREPRFYNAITYQGKSWHIQPPYNPDYTVDFAKGGGNDNFTPGREHYSGYIPYKRVNQQMLNVESYLQTWARPSIILRLADFYLYYAEACNEINPGDPEIVKYIDLVRNRAGIPGYKELEATGKKTGVIGNKAAQAKVIRQERQVEFFTEGQRYFDIRRWMICDPGEEADQTVYWGMNVDGVKTATPGTSESFFTRKLIRKHNWIRAMYLYPIPHAEIDKSTKLVQNPLW